jgi:NAD(P)-dependent dehydrogenase (short-subunit alcohol dehydrogenase family)
MNAKAKALAANRANSANRTNSARTAWSGAVCIVTGGASGIGRALATELARRGAVVHVADIRGDRAAEVAAEIGRVGGLARAAALDVRDASAFKSFADGVVRDAGRIDYLFNNAGIAIGGEAHDLTVAHWDRIIDINIRGVIHGVAACYPAMVARRGGHIVNTASMSGLVPTPLIAPYTMTKHAIVGLSRALRIEALEYGVKVSVLCPASVDTPLLDGGNPKDLPALSWRPNVRRMLERLGGPPYPADRTAMDALDAVGRGEGVIVIPGRARFGRLVDRWIPGLVEKLIAKALAEERATRDDAPERLVKA